MTSFVINTVSAGDPALPVAMTSAYTMETKVGPSMSEANIWRTNKGWRWLLKDLVKHQSIRLFKYLTLNNRYGSYR